MLSAPDLHCTFGSAVSILCLLYNVLPGTLMMGKQIALKVSSSRTKSQHRHCNYLWFVNREKSVQQKKKRMGGAPNRAERFGWWRANVQYNDLVVQMLLNCKSGARGRSRLFIMCLIAFDKCKLTSWLIRQKYIINMESGVPVSRAGSGLQCFAFHRRLAIVDSASLHSVDVNKFLLLQTRFSSAFELHFPPNLSTITSRAIVWLCSRLTRLSCLNSTV